jgi:hypothetical protein
MEKKLFLAVLVSALVAHTGWAMNQDADDATTKEPITGRTPLHLAALENNYEAVNELLKAGADSTVCDGEGKTALDIALEQNTAIIDRIVETQKQGPCGRSKAESYRKLRIEKILPLIETLRANMDYQAYKQNADDAATAERVDWLEDVKYDNPLVAAVAAWDHNEMFRLLWAGGTDVNAMTSKGAALHVGAAKPYFVQSLIEYKANVNLKEPITGRTPLHFAALGNSDEAVNELLKAGADSTVCDGEGKTALDIALEQNTAILDLIGKTQEQGPYGRYQAEGYRKLRRENILPLISNLRANMAHQAWKQKQASAALQSEEKQ